MIYQIYVVGIAFSPYTVKSPQLIRNILISSLLLLLYYFLKIFYCKLCITFIIMSCFNKYMSIYTQTDSRYTSTNKCKNDNNRTWYICLHFCRIIYDLTRILLSIEESSSLSYNKPLHSTITIKLAMILRYTFEL